VKWDKEKAIHCDVVKELQQIQLLDDISLLILEDNFEHDKLTRYHSYKSNNGCKSSQTN